MKTDRDKFILRYGRNYILHLPLKGLSLLVNKDTIDMLNMIDKGIEVENNEVMEQLINLKIILVDNFEESHTFLTNKSYQPTSVTLLPSFDCNLGCLYCYSKGGEITYKQIPLEVAYHSIDFICDNAKSLKKEKVHLSFHGGGEPFLPENVEFLKKSVKYFRLKCKKYSLKGSVSAATNGIDIFNLFKVNWINDNFSHLNLSLDGTPDIQNNQRPKRDGNPSYDDVLKTLKLFESNGIRYGIRTTITEFSVNRMDEIVEHFINISPSVKSFHLEPLFECGRCLTTKMISPDYRVFAKNFFKAKKVAENNGKELYYSGSSVKKVGIHFCGAAGSNFFVTPDSKITCCLEACRDEKENEPFLIGEFNKLNKQFEIDNNKINILKGRTVDKIENCQKCFCKFSCSGDCLIKVMKQTGDLMDTKGNERCRSNKFLTKMELQKMLS